MGASATDAGGSQDQLICWGKKSLRVGSSLRLYEFVKTSVSDCLWSWSATTYVKLLLKRGVQKGFLLGLENLFRLYLHTVVLHNFLGKRPKSYFTELVTEIQNSECFVLWSPQGMLALDYTLDL